MKPIQEAMSHIDIQINQEFMEKNLKELLNNACTEEMRKFYKSQLEGGRCIYCNSEYKKIRKKLVYLIMKFIIRLAIVMTRSKKKKKKLN